MDPTKVEVVVKW